jgi:hypothetical protein
MFTKIKEFFLGKPAPEAQAPYKIETVQHTHVEVAPVTAPIVAVPVKKPAAIKAAPKPKQSAVKKPAAIKAAPKPRVPQKPKAK